MPFNIGLPEMLVVLAIVLLFFGKDKLPETFRSFGKAIKGFKQEIAEIEDLTKTEITPAKTKTEEVEPSSK
jgi:sec-independent protein translocase protein TatA